jgi:stage V sporulation protein B
MLKENTFLKSTLILLIGGIFGKLVGFILKIIVTRHLGTEGMGLYSILSPTSTLLSVIAVFSYSNAVSKIISEEESRAKDLFISILPLSVLINIIFIIIIILFAPILSNTLLKEEELYYPIISLSLVMPFMSFSSIIKGYFWGKQNMMPYMLSNFIEQVVRLIIIVLFIDYFISISIIHALCFVILVNIIGEISSEFVMILFMPKIKFKLKDIKINYKDIKLVMNFCIPITFSKILSSISYFLEPIIITNMLLYVGYTKDYIVYEYGIINAYALSLLLMPQFFTQNMATSLVPELSKYYSMHNNKMCLKRIKQILLISCLIGGLSTIIITIFPNFFLNILYHTNEGIDYIKLLSPFTILFYAEYPLVNALQALGKSASAMKCTIISSIIRLICIVIFSLLHIGMYSLVISIIVNLITSTYMYYREIKKTLTN